MLVQMFKHLLFQMSQVRINFEEVKSHINACAQMSVGKHQMFIFIHLTHIFFSITIVKSCYFSEMYLGH